MCSPGDGVPHIPIYTFDVVMKVNITTINWEYINISTARAQYCTAVFVPCRRSGSSAGSGAISARWSRSPGTQSEAPSRPGPSPGRPTPESPAPAQHHHPPNHQHACERACSNECACGKGEPWAAGRVFAPAGRLRSGRAPPARPRRPSAAPRAPRASQQTPPRCRCYQSLKRMTKRYKSLQLRQQQVCTIKKGKEKR